MAGPYPYPESPYSESLPQQPFPDGAPRPAGPMYYPGQVPSAYPGMLPPPVNYPPPSRRKKFVLMGASALVVVLIVAGIVAIVLSSRGNEQAPGTVNERSATAAIQGYLDALSKGDDETVARNNACGFYDAIEDKRSDMTLANLGSDAFRRQFSSATVASIDKIVTWSPNQTQVLFTMRATPASRSQGEVQRQGVAQLLTQGSDILVCSYLPRSTGQY